MKNMENFLSFKTKNPVLCVIAYMQNFLGCKIEKKNQVLCVIA